MICLGCSNSLKFGRLTWVGLGERIPFYLLEISFPTNFLYFALVRYSKNERFAKSYMCFYGRTNKINLAKTCPLRLTLINFRGEHALAIRTFGR